eukprot:m.38624 g.38624  ORF g.38624 m.38624 type:complete len:58 (-) comp11503_c0_seq1:162-335(-)
MFHRFLSVFHLRQYQAFPLGFTFVVSIPPLSSLSRLVSPPLSSALLAFSPASYLAAC